MTRRIIDVEGGLIQGIRATEDVEVIVVDADAARWGFEPELSDVIIDPESRRYAYRDRWHVKGSQCEGEYQLYDYAKAVTRDA